MNTGYNPSNMNNMNFPNMNTPNIPRENEEYMYPEIYHKLAPITHRLIKDMEKQHGDANIYLNEDLLNGMVEEAIRRSGISNMNTQSMEYDDMDDEAVPTIAGQGIRHNRYDRSRRRYYDRDALSDIARILFLQELFGRRRHNWRWR